MSKPPSELWYKCLVQYVLLFNEKKKRKKRVEVEVEEAGSEGRDCKVKTPQQLLNLPHLNPLGFLNIL